MSCIVVELLPDGGAISDDTHHQYLFTVWSNKSATSSETCPKRELFGSASRKQKKKISMLVGIKSGFGQNEVCVRFKTQITPRFGLILT